MQKSKTPSSRIIPLLVCSNLLLLACLTYVIYGNVKPNSEEEVLAIKSEVMDYIAAKFIRIYNQQDLAALYAQFSHTAQNLLEREHVNSEFEKLFLDFSSLSKPEFLNLDFLTDYENKKVYKANYLVNCKQLESEKQNCLLSFTLGLENDFPEIFGVTLNNQIK